MQCYDRMCVHWKNNTCQIKDGSIQIDENGLCYECMHVEISDGLLEELRAEHLERISHYDDDLPKYNYGRKLPD